MQTILAHCHVQTVQRMQSLQYNHHHVNASRAIARLVMGEHCLVAFAAKDNIIMIMHATPVCQGNIPTSQEPLLVICVKTIHSRPQAGHPANVIQVSIKKVVVVVLCAIPVLRVTTPM